MTTAEQIGRVRSSPQRCWAVLSGRSCRHLLQAAVDPSERMNAHRLGVDTSVILLCCQEHAADRPADSISRTCDSLARRR